MPWVSGTVCPSRLQVSLRFDGLMPPEPLTGTGSTFGRSHHFDQIGRVSGEIVLHGETIAIDCLAVRDRTWGRRREDRPRQAAYVTGVASAAHGFLAVTNVESERNPVAYGFLRRDGRTVPLAHGERRIERDARETNDGRATYLGPPPNPFDRSGPSA